MAEEATTGKGTEHRVVVDVFTSRLIGHGSAHHQLLHTQWHSCWHCTRAQELNGSHRQSVSLGVQRNHHWPLIDTTTIIAWAAEWVLWVCESAGVTNRALTLFAKNCATNWMVVVGDGRTD